MNGFFTLTWSNIKSAVIYGFLTLVATFLLSIVQNVLNTGSVFGLDWKQIVDSAVIATLPTIIIALSLAKNLLTNSKGEFLGVTEVIPDKDNNKKE